VHHVGGDCHDLAKQLKLLFNISFLFFSFSFITKVEHGKISHDKSQSHKGVITVISQSYRVTVTICDEEVS